MKLFEAERPARYTGPIRDCPTKKEIGELDAESSVVFKKCYEEWAERFFVKHPRGSLSHNGFYGKTLVVRGTGDNGRWLVAWWLGESNEHS